MSVVRAGNRRSLAFTIAFAMLLALAVPFAGVAIANHDTVTLNVEEETATNAAGSTHTLTATISANAATHAAEIDFEVDCVSECSGATYTRTGTTGSPAGAENGGPVSAFDTPTDGDQAPQATDDTRTSPELSCSIPVGDNSCQVAYSRSDNGTDSIAGWIDTDNTTSGNATDNSDANEGQAESTSPGDVGEPDRTDVVSKTWFTSATAGVLLDCDDDDDDDTETNPPGQAEVYTCRAFTPGADATTTTDDTPISGLKIDAENLNGANDPDNSAGSTTPSTVDYNDACTTGSDGTCTYSLAASEGETGTADVCFWIDEDGDNEFDTDGAEFDGAACDDTDSAPNGDNEDVNTNDTTNKTDRVQKTWASPAAEVLDASPERDSNLKGTSHTVSATVTDQFGNPLGNQSVDFTVTGDNVGQGCSNVLTNASGVATCTYTDSTTVVGTEPQRDTISVCVDQTPANGVCDESDTTVDETDADLGDQVEKFWFTTFPTATTVRVDMDGGTLSTDCDDDDPTTADNPVEENHDICGVVLDSNGAAVAGKNVNLTLAGVGTFVDEGADTDNTDDGSRDDDTDLGDSITVTTDASGIWRATITSLEAGTSTITATADSATDTGTKNWVALTNARTLDCEPETAENPPGTEHLITCTALDRLGNPVNGEGITGSESGPGRFEDNTLSTGTDGTAEFVVSTTSSESGLQTIVLALDDDVNDDTTPLTNAGSTDTDDECDQAAGSPTAADEPAPAGVCADEVTKTWTDEPDPGTTECSDTVDNDGDGNIDFPDDAGCSSAEDDSEISETPRPCRNRTGGENVIVGTSGADVLTGTDENDIICGAGGDDVIAAKGGADLVVGNGGADSIKGGGGKDNLAGNGDNDTISGNRGNDAIKGQRGGDTLKGNNGIDSITGGKGADSLQGGDKGDILKGSAGNDTLRGGKGRDLLNGGGGTDLCFGNAGRDRVRGCE